MSFSSKLGARGNQVLRRGESIGFLKRVVGWPLPQCLLLCTPPPLPAHARERAAWSRGSRGSSHQPRVALDACSSGWVLLHAEICSPLVSPLTCVALLCTVCCFPHCDVTPWSRATFFMTFEDASSGEPSPALLGSSFLVLRLTAFPV